MKLLVSAVLCVSASVAWAEVVTPAPLAIDSKILEKAADSLGKPLNRITSNDLPQPQMERVFSIASLREVQVIEPLLQLEITNYWLPYLRKPVSEEMVAVFRSWVYQQLDERGYLASVDIKEQTSSIGSAIVVSVKPLRLGHIKVNAANGDSESRKYIEEVARRFANKFKPNSVIDVADLESQANAASFDLPVTLEVSIKGIEGGLGDVTVNLTVIESTEVHMESGAAQINNYGLSQYGREQALGVLRFEGGLNPQAVTTLVAQSSDHAQYFRAEYEVPLLNQHSHARAWSSSSNSSTALNSQSSARNDSGDVGFGITSLFRVGRIDTQQLSAEWNAHWSRDVTQVPQAIETGKSEDNQFRLRIKSFASRNDFDIFSNEITWIYGDLGLKNGAELAADQLSYQRAGLYQKLEILGGWTNVFNREEAITGSIRWHGQWSNKNLNIYNRVAMGGTGGIRAYTSADGSADEGLGLFFDIKKRMSENLYAGLLYDVAWLNVAKAKPNSSASSNNYTLQGAGFLLNGEVNKFIWNLSVAKSIGDAQGNSTDNSLTQLGEWRINLEVTRPF